MEWPRDACDDDKYSELDRGLLVVDIVTVDEPEELFIATSLLDAQNAFRRS